MLRYNSLNTPQFKLDAFESKCLLKNGGYLYPTTHFNGDLPSTKNSHKEADEVNNTNSFQDL